MNLVQRFNVVIPALALALAAVPAFAQSDGNKSDLDIKVNLGGGITHQFESDIDSGGDYDVTRFDIGTSIAFQIDPRLNLSLNLGYARDGYNFSGTTGFGGMDPWDDVNTFSFGTTLSYELERQWLLWGGPMFAYSAESGSDDDAFTGGGMLGFTYLVNDDFRIGGGVGIMSQIEDDVVVFPVITLNWQFAQDWVLRSTGSFGASGGGGVEVGWEFAKGWEAAFGGVYETRRFRLDDSGVAPDGVGDEELLPIYAKLSYQFNPTASASLMAGFIASGEIELDDMTGKKIMDDDFDSAAFISARFSLQF